MDENPTDINIPKWIWGLLAGCIFTVLGLLVSFFSWLGLNTVEHGNILSVQSEQMNSIQVNQTKIITKLDTLPPPEWIRLPVQLQALQDDAANREQQLDALERRVDDLEKIQ